MLVSFFRILLALLSYLLVYSRILVSEIALIPENRLQECSQGKVHLKFENQNMAFPFSFTCSSGFQAVLWNKKESEIYFGVGWIQVQFGQTCQLFCTGQADLVGLGLLGATAKAQGQGQHYAWLLPVQSAILQLCPLQLPWRWNGFGIFCIYMGFFPLTRTTGKKLVCPSVPS